MSDAAETPTQGMVMYSDGGARNPFTGNPNPGYGGYGIHGYLYHNVPAKKGIGVPGIVLTDDGYRSKAELEGEEAPAETNKPKFGPVTPVQYIDGYGSFGKALVSNNYCELVGAIRALQEAQQYPIKKLHLFSDSEYVIKGMNQGVEKWAKANWLQPDGQVRKNADTWKELVAHRQVLVERGVEVKFSWIEAHDGLLGNEDADKLATSGVMRSIAGKQEEAIERSPADGYWGFDGSRHPLLFQRKVYFNTDGVSTKPGEYFMGDHGKDDDAAGTRVTDGCYGIVRLLEPDPIIDTVRNFQAHICGGSDHIAFARLDNLFRQATYRQMTLHGNYAMEQKNLNKLDLFCLDREPLTKVFTPARTSSRIIEELDNLHEKFEWFQKKDPRLTLTDLTPILYEAVVKTPKKGEPTTHKQLKETYNVGYAALRLDANYQAADGTIQAAPITINLGVDMPDRNALKRLEELDPVVTLLSWRDSDTIFRYATVVETSSGVGIYAGVYSNLRIVEKAEKS